MHADLGIQHAWLVTRVGEGLPFCCRSSLSHVAVGSRALQFVHSQLKNIRRGCGLPLLENSFANADAYSAVTAQLDTHAEAHQQGMQ